MDADEAKRRSRGISTDMSPDAILRRIEIVSELYDMWRTLQQSRPVAAPAGEAWEPAEWRSPGQGRSKG